MAGELAACARCGHISEGALDATRDLGVPAALTSSEAHVATPAPSTIEVACSAPPQVVVTRRHMPEVRDGKTRSFTLRETSATGLVSEVKLYFTVGFFENGAVGEVFIKADRQGAKLSGALDAVGIFASMLLQYGVPLGDVIDKLRGMRFPPDGRVTIDKGGESVFATSPLDLLARWLTTFLPQEKTDG